MLNSKKPLTANQVNAARGIAIIADVLEIVTTLLAARSADAQKLLQAA